jgi:ATP-dependent protease ClpP protease subunit
MPDHAALLRSHIVNRAARPWYRIENKAATDVAKVYLLDEIGLWGVTAADFVNELQDITAPSIELHMSTPGGSVFDGLAIYQSLKDHPADVHVMVDGLAASAGSFIAQAGDRITIGRNAMMMIHKAQGVAVGDDEVMDEMGDVLRKHNANIADIYAQRAGGTVEDWLAAMKATTWYTGAEAVEAGLADEVSGADDDSEPENAWDLSLFAHIKTPDPAGHLHDAGSGKTPVPVADRAEDAAGTGTQAPPERDGALLARLFSTATKEAAK